MEGKLNVCKPRIVAVGPGISRKCLHKAIKRVLALEVCHECGYGPTDLVWFGEPLFMPPTKSWARFALLYHQTIKPTTICDTARQLQGFTLAIQM
jgi:hypothetical protein